MKRRLLPAIGALALLAGGLGVSHVLRRTTRPREGVVKLPGLRDRVELLRDTWGVPHIFASCNHDLFFAQGYVTAQDRLWQMELNRRIASGTLAEVLGRRAAELDRWARRIGFHRAAAAELDRLDHETAQALEAYCAGVNACIEGLGRGLPLEFVLLRHRPRPWTPTDCLAFGRFMAFTLSPNWDSELLRSALIARLGREAAARLEPSVWQADGDAVPRDVDYSLIERLMATLPARLPPLVPVAEGGGSNSWAVHGSRTTTGRPLLASDPHLYARAPSLWYEVHLCGGDYDVIGASLPGTPGVLLGHNRRIAWGTTAAMVDVQDLYLEQFTSDGSRYRLGDAWAEARVRREVIRVRGQRSPLIEDVLETGHGPVLTPLVQAKGHAWGLSLRSVVLSQEPLARALLAINRAGTWEQFRQALSEWVAPPLNFVYADVDGNIGYQMAGRVPVRSAGEGLVPSPGWSGQYEWTAYVPFGAMPMSFSPPEGFVASANHRVVDSTYPHFLGREWVDDFRFRRICHLLSIKERLGMEDMKGVQLDQHSAPAEEVLRLIEDLQPADQLEAEAVRWLRTWDLQMSPESVGAALYRTLYDELLALLFARQLGDLFGHLLGEPMARLFAPAGSYHYRLSSLLLMSLAEGGEAARSMVGEAFRQAVTRLREKLGEDLAAWRWGRLHQVTFQHSMGTRWPLDRLLSVGPHPVGGDADTVCQTRPVPGRGPSVAHVPSYRLVVDLGDWDRSVSVLPPGQSGRRASRHYSDQTALWLEGRYKGLPFSREAVEAQASERLLLEPSGSS